MNERQITPVTHQSNVPVGINFFDPTTIETLNRFSTMFANSSLVPESYRIGGVVGGKTGEGPKKRSLKRSSSQLRNRIRCGHTHWRIPSYGNAELVHCIWSPILVVQVPNCHYQYLWTL